MLQYYFVFFQRCLKWQPKRCFMPMTNMFWDYKMLSFMNINSKERENTTNSTSTKRRTRSQKTSGSLCSKLEVFIWRHVVYVPKLSTTFRGILICVIFRHRDMQEYYMLFGIFAKDVGLYFLSVFYIAWADFQYTNVYLFCVLHTYHCVPFTGECHGTVAYKAQTTSIYDVIGHRLVLFLPRVWTQSVWRTSY